MQDLIDRNKDGKDVADKINNRQKAAARFVCGMKLLGLGPGSPEWSRDWGTFTAFRNRAIELGAEREDIDDTYNAVEIPANFAATHVTKKSYNGYFGTLERCLDKMAEVYKFEYTLTYNEGQGWSSTTRKSYCNNGRCWPIAKELKIIKDGQQLGNGVNVVCVTNEGGGIYGWDVNCIRMYSVKDFKSRIKQIVERILVVNGPLTLADIKEDI